MVRRTSMACVVAVALAAGCGSKDQSDSAGESAAAGDDDKGPLSKSERAAVDECVKGLDYAAGAAPAQRLRIVAEACAAQEGFAAVANADASQKAAAIAEKTDILCDAAVKRNVGATGGGEGMAALVSACGADYYGLPEDATWVMSIDWFVVQRIGAWLGDAVERAGDPALEEAVDQAVAEVSVAASLPAALRGVYELPAAASLDRLDTDRYILVTSDAVRAGRMPRIQMTRGGATLAGVFPADAVDQGQGDADPAAGAAAFGDAVPVILADRTLPSTRVRDALRGLPVARARLGVVPRMRPLVAAHLVTLGAAPDAGEGEAEAEEPLALGDDATVADLAAALDAVADAGEVRHISFAPEKN